jgi:hypothetical protein
MNEQEIVQTITEYGFTFDKITHFRNHDRIKYHDEYATYTWNLRGHIEQLLLKDLIKCWAGEKR